MKIIKFLFLWIIFVQSLFAISIKLDGTISTISGRDCEIATYRLGTTASYEGNQLDILIKVLNEDNDYQGGSCVEIRDGVISFNLRDNDLLDNMAYMNIRLTVVKKGTNIPVVVDQLTITNFDLDTQTGDTGSDDIYYKNPTQTLISSNSNVVLQNGSYYGYNVKLRGQTSGNCDDSATTTELKCRAGAIWNNTSTIEARVQNDNAFSNWGTNSAYRLIQFSFESKDIAPLLDIIQEPFLCTNSLYLSNRTRIGTGSIDSGATWLHSINRENIPYDFDAIGEGYVSTDGGYNAIGYNVKDNFIYGMYKNQLVKIDKNGVVKELGAVEGFPNAQLYTGEFDRDGFYYVTGTGVADSQMYKIDINQTKVIQTITLKDSNNTELAVRFWDMAIDKSGDYFYAMLLQDKDSNSDFNNDKIAKIKISDGTITTIGASHADLSSYIGLVYSDIDGDIFMMSNENGFYHVNTETGEMNLLSSTSDLTFYNDGTSCPDANLSVADQFAGHFNIERTNSGSYPLMSDERNAWYTQIVGRDFDYSLVFYKKDFSAEKNISNVTVKVDLIDMDTNTSIYNYKFHIPQSISTSRIDITQPSNDLASLPATKNVRFKVTYGVDNRGNLIHANCLNSPTLCRNYQSDNAKDNFAIRPESYYMTILDKSKEIKISKKNDNTPLRISAGYDYNLSVIAQAQDIEKSSSKGYTTNDVKRVLEFLDKSKNVPVKDDYNATDGFIDGKNINNLFQIPEVGNYRLQMRDTTWTEVDRLKGDCIENNASSSANGNIRVGCNVVSPDINLASYPDHFAINLASQNLPNSTHDSFIYMSPMSKDDNNISISFEGSITAQNADNNTTQNFTSGYFSQKVALNLNTTILSDTGVNTPLRTSDGLSPVNIARTIEFNHDGNITLKRNPNLNSLPTITVDANQFTNEHNGTATIDIRYNIEKNITKTINPVQITFHDADAASAASFSIAHEKDEISPYIPTGNQALNTTRNFYFTKVSPDKYNYPRVNMNISPFLRTPLSVDIFCDRNTTYCTTTKVIANTEVSGTTREQSGWYLSIKHNGNIDGNVTGLTLSPSGTVNLSKIPTGVAPLSLPKGHNGMESATFIDCTNSRVEVNIVTDPVLNFQPNSYILNCTDNNASQWTGVGQTGNILEVKPTVNKVGKMDW